MTATRTADARAVAWHIIRAVHRDGQWTGPAVDRALRSSDLDGRDRAFASNLAFQTLRWQGTLDWALSQVVRRPLSAVEPGLHDLLRIGAWQLLYGRMPDRAAVSATVEVARAVLGVRTVGFCNGVLRALARRRERLPWPDTDSVSGLALRTGYPNWVVEAAIERFGPDATAQLEAGNQPAGLTVRGDDVATLRARLEAAGAAVRAGRLSPDALHVDGITPGDLVDRFPDAVIQDEASMVVGHTVAAAVPAGTKVLDVCAAPGGKATHLAALGFATIAADRSPVRLTTVARLAARLGLPLGFVVADGTRSPWRPDAFGAVLIDAPCSGLGVVRRRPELRWRRRSADVTSLSALQGELLAVAAPCVEPAGALIYSVCTWTRAETVDVVSAFVARHPGFSLATVAPPADAAGGSGGTDVQLTPAAHGCDGMYIAVLRRRE